MLYTQQEIENELAETLRGGRYNRRTTFGNDFAIANAFGADAVKDTFTRAFNEWKNDIVYLTELALVMNAYCWHFHEKGNNELSEIYAEYYYTCRGYAYGDNFSDHEVDYYFQCTD